MKIFKELYIKGSYQALRKFENEIGDFAKNDWTQEYHKDDRWSDYLIFNYSGKKVDTAKVFFYMKNVEKDGNMHVGNIVPTAQYKNQLTVEEYNNILSLFYDEVILPYTNENSSIGVSAQLSSDEFNPLSVLSHESLDKLTSFCNCANKSTGSSHPCDRERWFDFIFSSYKSGEIFSEDTLAHFLSDEEYWGKPDGTVLNESAWSTDEAWKLASEYSFAIEILENYEKWQG